MKRFQLLVLFSVFFSFSSVFARKDTGFLDRAVSSAGTIYRYEVYVPAGWDKHKKWPVMLFLHGAGERGNDGLLQTDVGLPHAICTRAADFQFLVVMPQCERDKVWTDPPWKLKRWLLWSRASRNSMAIAAAST